MLDGVKVKEIVAGVSSPEEILEIRKWMEAQHAKDQAISPTNVASMDVEELYITHFDWMIMTGELPMTTRNKHLKTYLAKDRISGFNDNKWKMTNYFMNVNEWNKIKISEFKLRFIHELRSIIHDTINTFELSNLLRFQ